MNLLTEIPEVFPRGSVLLVVAHYFDDIAAGLNVIRIIFCRLASGKELPERCLLLV